MPGAEPNWVGRTAFELLYARGLTHEASTEAREVYGRQLGHLIATLQSDEIDASSSEWRRAYLRYWQSVREVWLGGGLAAALGERMLQSARSEAARLGARDAAIGLAKHATVLPLIGAARSTFSATGTAVVLDFGHTAIKRGVAHYTGRALARLQVLAPLLAPPDPEAALRAVIEAVTLTLQEVPGADATVVASVASYVDRDGRLIDSHSRYAGVSSAAVEAALPGVKLQMGHDGTFAARGVQAPQERAAVIMLGTALGVGFSVPTENLRPLSSDFSVA